LLDGVELYQFAPATAKWEMAPLFEGVWQALACGTFGENENRELIVRGSLTISSRILFSKGFIP